jgi:transcriptional regulator with XRE-family HTH domain
MALVAALDRSSSGHDNDLMYERAAKRVLEWRREHRLSQMALAKLAHVSVGCLQSFERGTRQTQPPKLDKIARALGLTRDELLGEDETLHFKTNPLLRDLRPEDLRLAQAFHHAAAEVKYAMKLVFSEGITDERRDRVALMVRQLLTVDDSILIGLANLLASHMRESSAGQLTPALPEDKRKKS